MQTVQIMDNFYGYRDHSMLRLASTSGKFRRLCPPADPRRLGSFTSFINKFIFLIGGIYLDESWGNQCNSAEVYDIHRNIWMDAPPLKWYRVGHSTCSFNNEKLFTFGGKSYDNKGTDEIEVLNAKRFLDGHQDCCWESIYVKSEFGYQRFYAIMT